MGSERLPVEVLYNWEEEPRKTTKKWIKNINENMDTRHI